MPWTALFGYRGDVLVYADAKQRRFVPSEAWGGATV